MTNQQIQKIEFKDLSGDHIPFFDSGGILHVTNFQGGSNFLKTFSEHCIKDPAINSKSWESIFIRRNVSDFNCLAASTRVLKKLVHNHAFSMTIIPLVERIGCSLAKTHVDCGVIRYQLTNNLRDKAKNSGLFEVEDFARINPNSIPEIFGYDKLPPHRDVRWPHIRILGGWMPLTDVDQGEALTLFPDVFDKQEALTDPNITPFPSIGHPDKFGLGKSFSPAMKAGDLLLFHASTVHASPVHQRAPFRGSVDFRLAYPCIDDFAHYKWTFVQAKNLIFSRGRRQKRTSLHLQKRALDSFTSELFENSGLKNTVHEIRLSHEKNHQDFNLLTIIKIIFGHFCPDTFLRILCTTTRLGRRLLLTAMLMRSDSYFWLYKSYLEAKRHKLLILAKMLKVRAIKISLKTKLPIKNTPITWPGEPRELLPEAVLEDLKKRQ